MESTFNSQLVLLLALRDRASELYHMTAPMKMPCTYLGGSLNLAHAFPSAIIVPVILMWVSYVSALLVTPLMLLPHALKTSALVVSVQHPSIQRVHPDCTQPSVARLTHLLLHPLCIYTPFGQSWSSAHH